MHLTKKELEIILNALYAAYGLNYSCDEYQVIIDNLDKFLNYPSETEDFVLCACGTAVFPPFPGSERDKLIKAKRKEEL